MNKYTAEEIRRMAEYITGADSWNAGGLRFADGPAGLRVPAVKNSAIDLSACLPATCFPAHSALACSFNRSLAEGVGRRIGEEAAAAGVDILLAPAVNIKRNPLNGRNFEYFSEDAYLTGELGAAYVRGVQSTGVGACVKHFVANNRETARSASDSVMSQRTLRELYLPAFKNIVQTSAPAAVMTSYNKLNGVYCNESPRLITQILREEWGFKGIVVSDWGGIYDRVQSVRAGTDVEMPACAMSTEILVQAYKRGEISGEYIEACANRLKSAAARPTPAQTPYNAAEHAEFAYAAACESEVLLKNDGVLPLKKGSRVAVFGTAATDAPVQGGGSSHLAGMGGSNILAELKKVFTVTGYSKSYKKFGRHAKKIIGSADAVIVCLAMYEGDTEGQDKISVALPKEQTELFSQLSKCGKKVVCLLSCGGAINTCWDRYSNALLYLGLSGQGTARAAADILCGKVNPSGRLAESFFVDINELPSTKYFGEAVYHTVYAEGLSVGYRYYKSQHVPAKYPFGYGLGYSNFIYGEPVADSKGVTFTVTNAGEVAGADIPQIYIEFPAGAHEPPRLAGFEKIFLNAGESRQVFIPFTPETFSVYDADSRRSVTVNGEYAIQVSKNSQNAVYSPKIIIEGEAGEVPADVLPASVPTAPRFVLTARGRVRAELLTPFGELKNSNALLTRLFVRIALFALRGDPMRVGTLRHSPVRTVAQFAGFDKTRTDGFIEILNGHYIKGLRLFLKGKTHKNLK